MNYDPVKRLTPEQVSNLRRLADYLARLPKDYKHFDMNTYFDNDENLYLLSELPTEAGGDHYLHSCGAVACAVGHGPAAGIPVPQYCDNWDDYVDIQLCNHGLIFVWCFAGRWANVDNTPHGAAKRIRWMLEHGLPENIYEQMAQVAPLCYYP